MRAACHGAGRAAVCPSGRAAHVLPRPPAPPHPSLRKFLAPCRLPYGTLNSADGNVPRTVPGTRCPGTSGEWRRVAGRKECARAPDGPVCRFCSRAWPPPSLGCTLGPRRRRTSPPPPRHRQLLTGTGSGEGHPAPRGPAPLTPQVTPQLAGWDPSLLGAPRSCSQWGVTSCSGGNSRVDPGPSKRPGCELQLWVGPPAVAWTASWNARVTDLPPTAPQAENLDLGPSASRPPPQTRRPLREASQHVGRGGRAECRRPQAPRWLGRAGGGWGGLWPHRGLGAPAPCRPRFPSPCWAPAPRLTVLGRKNVPQAGTGS